ncbi:hypothetical protein D1872_261290 [compost metagenome]
MIECVCYIDNATVGYGNALRVIKGSLSAFTIARTDFAISSNRNNRSRRSDFTDSVVTTVCHVNAFIRAIS